MFVAILLILFLIPFFHLFLEYWISVLAGLFNKLGYPRLCYYYHKKDVIEDEKQTD